VLLEFRFADGAAERLPQLARDLVALKPDVIVATTDAATFLNDGDSAI
jgi:hypothetical protein